MRLTLCIAGGAPQVRASFNPVVRDSECCPLQEKHRERKPHGARNRNNANRTRSCFTPRWSMWQCQQCALFFEKAHALGPKVEGVGPGPSLIGTRHKSVHAPPKSLGEREACIRTPVLPIRQRVSPSSPIQDGPDLHMMRQCLSSTRMALEAPS